MFLLETLKTLKLDILKKKKPPDTFGSCLIICSVGDSMSKVQEKRLMSKSGFFLWNMKDSKANWWFLPFFDFYFSFGVFSAKNQKYLKITVLKKWKFKKKKLFFFKDWTTQLSINGVVLTKPLTTSLSPTSKQSSHLRKPSKGCR